MTHRNYQKNPHYRMMESDLNVLNNISFTFDDLFDLSHWKRLADKYGQALNVYQEFSASNTTQTLDATDHLRKMLKQGITYMVHQAITDTPVPDQWEKLFELMKEADCAWALKGGYEKNGYQPTDSKLRIDFTLPRKFKPCPFPGPVFMQYIDTVASQEERDAFYSGTWM